MASPEGQLTIPEAINIIEQHQPGDIIHLAVTRFLGQKLDQIWNRVRAQPATYMLTKEEFAVFDYHRDIFGENEIVQQALQRFWEHESRKLSDEPEPKESTEFHVKTPKTDFLEESNSTVTPSYQPHLSKVATRSLRHNNNTQYGFKISNAAEKGRCEPCIRRRLRCDGERPVCGYCRRVNVDACAYTGGTGYSRLNPSMFDMGMMFSEESSVTPTSSYQYHAPFHYLSLFEGSDRMDKHDAADAFKRCEQRMTECDGEHPESPENLSQEPHKMVHISHGAYREQHKVSRDGQAIEEDEASLQAWEACPEHLESPKSLPLDLSHFRLRVLNGREYSLANSMKLWVQILTGEAWDWWPLRPCFRQLLDDEVRIQWYCVSYLALPSSKLLKILKNSGHTHWRVLPKNDLVPALEALNSQATTLSLPSERKNPQSSSKSRSSANSSRSSESDSSVGDSSPPTSEGGSSDQPDDDAGLGKKYEPSGTSTAVDIIPPSNLVGFVLFGVHGSKRLQNANLRLAQIDVAVYKDDDSFFDEMFVQYQKLRGFLRRIFSIWVFHTCEFVMFYKSNPNEIMPGPKEMPSHRNRDYDYNASRSPPIPSTVFNANFYGCKKGCIKSQLDLFCLLHECKGRNHCGKYRVLDRLPKRRRKWAIDRDKEAEEAWGLNTVFAVSFYRVTLYHMLILVGPILFWGLWLKKRPSDWQNASVPFFAVVVLLSLFWLPFAHKASPRDNRRSWTNKSI